MSEITFTHYGKTLTLKAHGWSDPDDQERTLLLLRQELMSLNHSTFNKELTRSEPFVGYKQRIISDIVVGREQQAGEILLVPTP